MPGVLELAKSMISGIVLAGVMLALHDFRGKSIGYRLKYAGVLVGGVVVINLIIEWLSSSAYKAAVDYTGIALIWVGPVFLFAFIGWKEWRYGIALIREKRSPLVGWDERYDNTERDETSAVAYGRSRQTVAVVAFVLAVIWFHGGFWLFVA